MMKFLHLKKHEIGLRYHRGEFTGVLPPGKHTILDPLGRTKVDVVDCRSVYLHRDDLDLIVRSGALVGRADVHELTDTQRALVWIDGRFSVALGPGLHVLLTGFRRVRVETIDTATTGPRLVHPDLEAFRTTTAAHEWITFHDVPPEHVGVVAVNGRRTDTLPPGLHAFWKKAGAVKVAIVDRREATLDISGQEILTADKVTLRLNAQVVYRVADAEKAAAATDDVKTVVYREAQMALRIAVGSRDLDALLADKEALAAEATGAIRPRAAEFGVDVVGVGVRDLILPGDMRTLLNKVIEAKKLAEAGVITRREEAAALRHQANAAKLYADHPTLLRLRELEAVERVATAGKLSVILGDKGLADRVVNLM